MPTAVLWLVGCDLGGCPNLSMAYLGGYRASCCGWKARLSSRAFEYHGQEIDILEQDQGPYARLSVDAPSAASAERASVRSLPDLNVDAPRATMLITSTPIRRGSVHPSLRPMGRGAPRYLRRVRRRDRRTLTRRGATGLLAFGVLISGPALTITSGPDASASRSPRANVAVHKRTESQPMEPRSALVPDNFVVPISAPVLGTTRSTSELTIQKFVGAYARRNGKQSWITYPTGRYHPFLVCTRGFESDTAGGYAAVSPDGRHRGAYQFKRSTWNTVARNVGRDELIGVDPAAASAADQDWMALYLYKWLGASHWEGRCAGK